MLPKKIPFTKWSRVVGQNSRFTLSTTSDKVMKIIGQTLVCVPIYLECWLDKARVEIGLQWVWHTNSKLQFGYNSVTKFGQCESINVDSIHIRCASGVCMQI